MLVLFVLSRSVLRVSWNWDLCKSAAGHELTATKVEKATTTLRYPYLFDIFVLELSKSLIISDSIKAR